MTETLEALIAALDNEVKTATIADDSRHTAAWCVGQLSDLYTKYCQTSESRYAEEITRLVQALIRELGKSKPDTTAPQPQPVSVIERFRLLHEQLGLPRLELKLPPVVAPRSRSRKAG